MRDRLTKLRVDEVVLFVHIDGARLGPRLKLLPVNALVRGGIGNGNQGGRRPLKGDEADVAKTHDGLPEKVDTMLRMKAVHFFLLRCEVGVVVVCVHVLVKTFLAAFSDQVC